MTNETKIERLAILFQEREDDYVRTTKQIFEIIRPNVLEGIAEFFKTTVEAVQWHEIKISDASVVILASFVFPYESSPEVDKMVEELQATDDLESVQIQKMMQIMLPVPLLLETKENIVVWLDTWKKTQENTRPVPETVKPLQQSANNTNVQMVDFDPRQLTRDQIAQMLFFQHTTKGIKQ